MCEIQRKFPTHILKGSGRSGTPTPFGIPKAAANSEKERKGWTVTIHDLSGATVAAACISTPFVSVKGAGKVSGRNPGAWLILRPDPGIISIKKSHALACAKCFPIANFEKFVEEEHDIKSPDLEEGNAVCLSHQTSDGWRIYCVQSFSLMMFPIEQYFNFQSMPLTAVSR